MRLQKYTSRIRLFNAARRSQNVLILFCLFAFFTSAASAQKRVNQKGTRGEQIYEAEKLLADLGYWITNVDQATDASTHHAIIAFQKVEGRQRTGILNESELQAMRAAARPLSRFMGDEHIEVDITRQVLFVVNPYGVITHILPISTGSEEKYLDEGKWQVAHKPRGTFRITRKIFGVRHAPLGSLYYPNYFSGGVAIHGSNSIPVLPASHGCVRIPNFAAEEFYALAPVGMLVIVYD